MQLFFSQCAAYYIMVTISCNKKMSSTYTRQYRNFSIKLHYSVIVYNYFFKGKVKQYGE